LRIVTAPGSSNANLRAQQGLFTLLEAQEDRAAVPLDRILPEIYPPIPGKADHLARPVLLKAELETTHAPRLLRLLAIHGIDAAHLFPGFGGVVDSLKDELLWEK
jgi:hypothetical protein